MRKGITGLVAAEFRGEFTEQKPDKPKNFDAILEQFLQRKNEQNEQNESGRLNTKNIARICTDTCNEDEKYTEEEIRPSRTEVMILADISSSMDGKVWSAGVHSRKRTVEEVTKLNQSNCKQTIVFNIVKELISACKTKETNYDLTTRLFVFGNHTTEVPVPNSDDELR